MLGISVGDLGRLKDFVSPSFFDVVPARTLWKEGRRLLASRRDTSGFAEILKHLEPVVSGPPVGLELVDRATLRQGGNEHAPKQRGETLLRLYFAQLAHLDVAALDLRHANFRWETDHLQWAPAPLSVHWDAGFICGLRDLYSGFYRDDDALFHDAAQRLNLTPAVDLFIEHFGSGDQRFVVFEQEAFKDSFHSVFVRCRDAGQTLAPGFISLGVMLGALYEHLGTLAVPLDVRGAFEAVWPR
jgi:hypothetical protein